MFDVELLLDDVDGHFEPDAIALPQFLMCKVVSKLSCAILVDPVDYLFLAVTLLW